MATTTALLLLWPMAADAWVRVHLDVGTGNFHKHHGFHHPHHPGWGHEHGLWGCRLVSPLLDHHGLWIRTHPGARRGHAPWATGVVRPPVSASGSYPVRPSGWIVVRVTPPDAVVLVDGARVTRTPLGLLTGSHRVEVWHPHYGLRRMDVEVQQARTTEVVVDLTAMP